MTVKKKRNFESLSEDIPLVGAEEEISEETQEEEALSERGQEPKEIATDMEEKSPPIRKIRVINPSRPQTQSSLRNTPRFSPFK